VLGSETQRPTDSDQVLHLNDLLPFLIGSLVDQREGLASLRRREPSTYFTQVK